MKTIKNKKGFTLIELILYIAIISIFVVTLVPFVWGIIQGSVRSSVQQEVTANARYLIERINSEIRNSNGFNTSDFGVNLAGSAGTKLSLIQDAPNNPTLIDVLAGKVRITEGASAAVNLNSTDTKVTSIIFTNYTSADNKTKNIAYEITVEGNYAVGRTEYVEVYTIKSAAEMRSNN